MQSADAVVIGSGPNGLVAANLLADAGWEVLVLEAQPHVGGAVHSDSTVHPGYVHDTFSSFYPLTVISPAMRALRLEDHGLQWSHAPAVVGTPMQDGRWALLHRRPHDTAAALDELHPGDGQAWLDLLAQWAAVEEHLVGAILTPFPPVRHGLGLLRRLPKAGGMDFARLLVAPVASIARERFGGPAPGLLLAGNAAHADIPMDGAGSGLMGVLLCMVGQRHGFPVPRGGAGQLAGALARRFESLGGTIRTGCRVTAVDVEHGRASGVRTEDGERVAARRAVIADVTAPSLYGGLVALEHLPARVRTGMRRFEWDPGTIKVDWALSGPIPWRSPPAEAPGTPQLLDSVGGLSLALTQVGAGWVPAEPFLLMGQMATADPTRAPAGAESAWAYTHVPHQVRGDAGHDELLGSTTWDEAGAERMADRMQARLERDAPGFSELVVARRVLGPRQLQARDENLVLGSLNGGTANLQQELVFRPVPGLGRAGTPVAGLFLGSASAHPGGAVHGACGANAARAALAHDRLRRLTRRA